MLKATEAGMKDGKYREQKVMHCVKSGGMEKREGKLRSLPPTAKAQSWILISASILFPQYGVQSHVPNIYPNC